MTQFPLARYFGPDSVVARGPGTVVTLCQMLGDIETPARTLPERKYVINLCEDRYLFLTGVAAAMVRGQVSLLPSARTPHALYELAEVYPDLYCLCERPDGIPEGLEVALGHSISSARYPSTTMPAFPVQTGYTFHSARPFFPEDIRSSLEELEAPRILVTTPLHLRACILDSPCHR